MNGWMGLLARLPFPVLRGLGRVTGELFYRVSARRRKVVLTNLGLCFPTLDKPALHRLARAHFGLLGQSLWDRIWLWHAPEPVLLEHITFQGDFSVFDDPSPLIVLAPHVVGLDAGGVAMTLLKRIPMACVYVPMRSKWVENWTLQGRNRSGRVRSVARDEGVQPLLRILRDGMRLHYSPDMDFGIQGAVWADFFGVQAATTHSLPRLAKVTHARVCTLFTHLTPSGYRVTLGPVWQNYPTDDAMADTKAMNTHIENGVRQDIAQYYWVHKRFKTRPEGEASFYA